MSLIRRSVEALKGYTPGEQPIDPAIVKLNTNENPYAPSPKVAEALRGITLSGLSRYPDPMCVALRKRLAELHGCSLEQVFVGNGSDEVLALCTRAFVENDGTIGFFNPSYSLYNVLAEIRDVGQHAVSLNDDFSWPIDAAVVELTDDPGCSLFFFTNPNAPTGRLCPREDVRRFCAGFGGVVVVDEAYVDFSSEDCASLALELDNVLVARTFSKSYSLAGLRLGYAIGAPALIEALYKIKDSYNVDGIAQVLGLAAVTDQGWMKDNAARVVATRERLCAALEHLGFRVCPSQANFLWVEPPAMEAKEMFDALRAHRILVRYFPGERTGRFLRITVGTDDHIDRLLSVVNTLCSGV
ncbi:MAG: histidinol-phosphate transaminase [Lentisphaerae bacterium]|nr:histidinol-phosphate transaminase [Lentisphaerota bacterium]